MEVCWQKAGVGNLEGPNQNRRKEGEAVDPVPNHEPPGEPEVPERAQKSCHDRAENKPEQRLGGVGRLGKRIRAHLGGKQAKDECVDAANDSIDTVYGKRSGRMPDSIGQDLYPVLV